MVCEVGMNGVADELESGSSLLRAGGDHGPDALAPLAPGGAARALGDAAVDHNEAQRPFGQVIGRRDARGREEGDVSVPVFSKAFREVHRVFDKRHMSPRKTLSTLSGKNLRDS